MPVELAICRHCGSDNLEVIEAAGVIGADAIIGLGYPGVTVGDQFACHECGVISDACAVQDIAHPAEQALDRKLRTTERGVIALAQIIVAKLREQRSEQTEASRRIADREQWKGLSW